MFPSILAVLQMPFQIMGYATTCTQGDSDSAMAGAIYSGLFLLTLLGVLLRRTWVRPKHHYFSYMCAALLMGTMLLTFDIWFGTLAYGTPCGREFSDYAVSSVDWVVILTGYLILPTLNVLLCLNLIRRHVLSPWQKSGSSPR